LGGHNVTLVCRKATAQIFNENGSIVRIPIRGQPSPVELRSKDFPAGSGILKACTPDQVLLGFATGEDVQAEYDLVILAMQEPQYSAPDVRKLVQCVAAAKLPVMAITNMPLPPYLARIPGLKHITKNQDIRSCYKDPDLWDAFLDNVGLFTQCSPDPQAFRPPEEPPNVLQVRLPTNFKAANFENKNHTEMLSKMERDMQSIQFNLHQKEGETSVQIPVKLRVHQSIFVPLAKWAMLMAGNYRCIQPYPKEIISIKDAVTGDLDASQQVYSWVVNLCVSLGGEPEDFVPFSKYLEAAKSLESPSSASRALAGGATSIERVDKVVALIGHMQQGQSQLEVVDSIVKNVDNWLRINNEKQTSESKKDE
jgi:hypothetical protein